MSIVNCTLFSAGEASYPETKGTVDSLSFKQILTNTSEKFDFQDYDDLFADDFVYVNAEIPSDISNKDKILSRLNTIISKNVIVKWYNESGKNDPQFDKDKLITLAPRTSKVNVIKTINNKDSVTTYTGESIFELIYDTKIEVWRINRWRDKNTTNNGGKSYFHPLF